MEEVQKQLKRINRRTRFTLFLVWIALFFTAAGIAAGYKNWLRIHEKAKSGIAGVAEINKQLPSFANKEKVLVWQDKMNRQLNVYKEEFDGSVKQLRHIQDSTQYIADTVYGQVEALTVQQESTSKAQQVPTVRNWSISEVHFLLQTAVQVFAIKQDKRGALSAFKAADELLLKKGSSQFLQLRKSIGKDMALVSGFTLPNISSLLEKINNLQKQLEPTDEMLESTSKNVEVQEKELEKEEESLVSRVKKTLNEAVVVRKFDKTLHSDMDALTKRSLYQLLSLRLESLKVMLIQGQDKSFHQQILYINDLLGKFYSKEKLVSLKKQLEILDSVNLKPNVPDISSSLKLLETLEPEL